MKIRASLFVASVLASACCFAAQTYQVSTSVYLDGKLIASPVMVVEANKMASITVGEDFSYNLTVKPNQGDTVDVITAVTLGKDRVTPSFTVAYGKEASMEMGPQKLTLLVTKVGS